MTCINFTFDEPFSENGDSHRLYISFVTLKRGGGGGAGQKSAENIQLTSGTSRSLNPLCSLLIP